MYTGGASAGWQRGRDLDRYRWLLLLCARMTEIPSCCGGCWLADGDAGGVQSIQQTAFDVLLLYRQCVCVCLKTLLTPNAAAYSNPLTKLIADLN
jgi:hypothetical protein